MLSKNIVKLAQIFVRKLNDYSIFLLPPLCLLCADPCKNRSNLCAKCQKDLPILPHNCYVCGRFLTVSFAKIQCGFCLKAPPAFAQTYALFPYQDAIIHLISALKYQGNLASAACFREALKARLPSFYPHGFPDVIVPVPLHKNRLKMRGFNQAIEIIRPVAKHFCIPFLADGLVRIRDTPPQSQLGGNERKYNIINSFYTKYDFTGKTIALFDDVMTTGMTVNSCAKILKKAGATRIDIWCAARRS